jgi:hypothetical protein
MFESWQNDPDYPTLFRVDREVVVDVSRAFPDIRGRRQDELSLWVKASGLRLEPTMCARQIAWVRRASDGGWLAVVLMPAASRARDADQDKLDAEAAAVAARAEADEAGPAATAARDQPRLFLGAR